MNRVEVAEPRTTTEFWYEWMSYRIRHYFILDVVFILFFCFILSNSYQIRLQNERTLELISILQLQIDNIEERVNRKYEPMKNKPEEKPVVQPHIKTTIRPPVETPVAHHRHYQNTSATLPIFNAANFLFGAKVVNGKSPGSDELILLDRPNPPAEAAWCSTAQEPILTIRLAKYIKPVSVSYQHSKWIGKVPYGAPRSYDVYACFDEECTSWEALAYNCEYESKEGKQEQSCDLKDTSKLSHRLHLSFPPIKIVQFRFTENHGHVRETCVSLLRVFGEKRENSVDRGKQEENSKQCASLARYYYNFYPLYAANEKNCSVLYSRECCDECPECCDNCVVNDHFWRDIINISFWVFLLFFVCGCISCISRKNRTCQ